MPLFYSELKEASLENLSSDPSAGVEGRFYRNTTENRVKTDDGSIIRALLRNDDKLVIGNDSTANNNIRINRAANALMQFILGGDATAEGSSSSSLAKASFKFEDYVDSGKPTNGNAGRVIWVSDKNILSVDNGSTWVPVGSGGGGGSLRFIDGSPAPLEQVLNDIRVYSFAAGESQNLHVNIKLSNSYVTGSPVNLRALVYSSDNTGDVLLKAQATLIRTGTDAITDTTNQRTTTNTAITLSAGTVDEPQAVVLDISSSIGEINSVACSPGDLIKVRIYRDTDTATGGLQFMPDLTELTIV